MSFTAGMARNTTDIESGSCSSMSVVRIRKGAGGESLGWRVAFCMENIMDLQDLQQELQEVEKLREKGKLPEATALLNKVQKELKAHPVKNPRKHDPESNLPMNLCDECGREGSYREQEDLCDFCYVARRNLNPADILISQKNDEEDMPE